MNKSKIIEFLVARELPSGGLRVIYDLASELNKRNEVIVTISKRENIEQRMKTSAKIRYSAESNNFYGNRLGSLYNLYAFIKQFFVINKKSDVIIATYYPTAFLAYIKSVLNKNIKAFYLVQHDESLFCSGRFVSIKKMIARFSYRLPLIKICNSQWTANEISHYTKNNEMINVIPIGIDLNKFSPCDINDVYVNADRLKLSVIARTQEIKGWPLFLQAINLLEGLYKEKIDLTVITPEKDFDFSTLSISHKVVIPSGDDDIINVYQDSDIFISTSIAEGFGLPPLEAMACFTAVITTDSGGINEFCKNNINCLVVEHNPLDIANAIKSLVVNPALITDFKHKGLSTASQFSWRNSEEKMMELIINE